MAPMSGNDECTSRNFGDSSKLTNWILDSGSMCHMTPEIMPPLRSEEDMDAMDSDDESDHDIIFT